MHIIILFIVLIYLNVINTCMHRMHAFTDEWLACNQRQHFSCGDVSVSMQPTFSTGESGK